MTVSRLLARRTQGIEVSGIRKVFDLGKSLKNPCNLSIGQPHFPVPDAIKTAAKAAIDGDKNGYTVTQGAAEFLARLQADTARRFPGPDRAHLVTSGTSGGLLLALFAVIDPGDEVIVLDPYFVSYPNMVHLAGGVLVRVPSEPDFQLDPDRVIAQMTSRTKAVMLCSPANPTGAVYHPQAMAVLAKQCRERGILLISDEIYRAFHYDSPPRSPAEFDDQVLVVEGFGKTYGITGWRLGYVHGPREIVEEMTKLQQLTFVCAPSIAQYAGLAAMDFDVTPLIADYRRKRDRLVAGLRDRYDFAIPAGAFYLYAKVPSHYANATEFVRRAIEHELLIIPGSVFSVHDTHFRVSYAAADDTLDRGIEILNRLAQRA